MRRLRIAIGSVYPGEAGRIRGGIEAAAVGLTEALARRADLEVHVVSSHPLKRGDESRGGVTIHWVPTGRRLTGLRTVTTSRWAVRAVYRALAPDLVHAQGFSPYAVAAGGLPLVLTVHGVEWFAPSMQGAEHYRGPVGPYRRAVEGWVARQSLERAGVVISVAGDYTWRVLGSALPTAARLESIANPVPEEFFSVPIVGPSAARSVPGPRVILGVGDLVERKNALGLIRAFARVAGRWPTARLELAGGESEPAYARRVRQLIDQLGLTERVRLLGRLDQAALIEAYTRAAIVALASRQETAPMAIGQALAAARPVVATDVGGVSAMVRDGGTGYVVSVDDEAAFAERLIRLGENAPLRKSFGVAARADARLQFGAEPIAARTAELYRNLLDWPGKGASSETSVRFSSQ